MDLRLDDKVALVLAASKGIGKGVASALAREGCHVLIASSNAENLASAKKEIENLRKGKVDTFVIDVASPGSLRSSSDEILKAHGHIDILVTNSPGPEMADAATVDEDLLAKALQINLVSVIFLCKAFLPGMIKNRFGRIINLASITAKEPDAGMVLSNVTRAGTMAYCKTLSREVAQYGVTVNTILTGGVQTERAVHLRKERAKKLGVSPEELLAQASKNFPVGFIATPEEFSHMIAFLASPLSLYVNGVSLPVDGGFMRSF